MGNGGVSGVVGVRVAGGVVRGGGGHGHVFEELHVGVADVSPRTHQHSEAALHVQVAGVPGDLLHRHHHLLLHVGAKLEQTLVSGGKK